MPRETDLVIFWELIWKELSALKWSMGSNGCKWVWLFDSDAGTYSAASFVHLK